VQFAQSTAPMPAITEGTYQPQPVTAGMPGSSVGAMVRPVTGTDVGIVRAEIRPGLREIILCKDQDRKVGLRLRAIDNANSPAALAGLRFGDQVLQINGQNCAGWSTDKAHKALKAAAETRIEMVVRDR
ncbi:hypothetical protein XENOCAPTIV_020839, partial [Xenoophorus captivus]